MNIHDAIEWYMQRSVSCINDYIAEWNEDTKEFYISKWNIEDKEQPTQEMLIELYNNNKTKIERKKKVKIEIEGIKKLKYEIIRSQVKLDLLEEAIVQKQNELDMLENIE